MDQRVHLKLLYTTEAVNTALMETYWAIGEHLSRKVAGAGWGKGVVKELAAWLLRQAPELSGFSAQNFVANEAILRGFLGG